MAKKDFVTSKTLSEKLNLNLQNEVLLDLHWIYWVHSFGYFTDIADLRFQKPLYISLNKSFSDFDCEWVQLGYSRKNPHISYFWHWLWHLTAIFAGFQTPVIKNLDEFQIFAKLSKIFLEFHSKFTFFEVSGIPVKFTAFFSWISNVLIQSIMSEVIVPIEMIFHVSYW